ncbi:MAG: GreA/GreB family elongation factor, partial [Saccharospirillaceae bacterium]|nr:GreA/GreB family elongation factor [Pseudomonadales bacterium]NRB81803.1 GreA/GreB family elongation factor [Saccharospirillaceae bacterium]
IECDESIEVFSALKVINFEQNDKIKLGALIKLESESNSMVAYYFLSPCSGGVKLSFDGLDITLITPTAPLGKLLLGKQVDDEIVLNVQSALNAGEQVMIVLDVR